MNPYKSKIMIFTYSKTVHRTMFLKKGLMRQKLDVNQFPKLLNLFYIGAMFMVEVVVVAQLAERSLVKQENHG